MKHFTKALTIYIYLIGMIGFSLFIIEEASQVATFSTFMSKNNNDLTLMLSASKIMDINNNLIKTINKSIGWISPFTYISYNKYAEAQDLYSQCIKYHILAHQPELLEGEVISFQFTPNQISNGILSNGRIRVIANNPSLDSLTVKGIVSNGKVYHGIDSMLDRSIEQLHDNGDG
jgi:hypothetical protein